MDNWIAHTLLLMLNIDFLSGFPDLNSFFPFEMEEDFLFALGHRFEPTHHGKMPLISNIKALRLFTCIHCIIENDFQHQLKFHCIKSFRKCFVRFTC